MLFWCCFGRLLAIKCVLLNNYIAKPTLIGLDLNKLQYCPFMVNPERYNESCNTVEDPFGRTCISIKIEDINLEVFNMITEIHETKILIKYISYDCRSNLKEENKIHSKNGIMISVDVSVKIQ